MKKFLLIGCLFISAVGYGQFSVIQTDSIPKNNTIISKNDYHLLFRQNFDFGFTAPPSAYSGLSVAPMNLGNPFMSGMFCKMEYKIEGVSKLSPRFRLGSLNYTEWMEGKKEIYTRYWK